MNTQPSTGFLFTALKSTSDDPAELQLCEAALLCFPENGASSALLEAPALRRREPGGSTPKTCTRSWQGFLSTGQLTGRIRERRDAGKDSIKVWKGLKTTKQLRGKGC